jgi:nitrogen regulatory protein PII
VNGRRTIRITALVKRSLAKPLLSRLSSSGMSDCYVTSARAITLQEKRGGLGLIHFFKLLEEAVEMVAFFVEPAQEEQALDFVIRHCELTLPGHGTVFSEEVTLLSSYEFRRETEFQDAAAGSVRKPSPLVGICCIVQRGEANRIARVALDMGSGVPAVSFGTGTGIRDKLGLLRIAIPAQKEIIHLALNPHDAETVMRMMIRAGELDRPGKGFMFIYPIREGWVDTKIVRGFRRHVASVEQIIATLDELKGDMGWRRRSERQMLDIDSTYFLLNLKDLTLLCNEGTGQDLVKQAMKAGAGGATISRLKHHCPPELKPKGMSSAREACNMCIAEAQIDKIIHALEEAEVFDEKASGEIVIRNSPKAYTYS